MNICSIVIHNCQSSLQRKIQESFIFSNWFFFLSIPNRLMQAACDVAFPYLHERKAFGKPIGEFQVSRELRPLSGLWQVVKCTKGIRINSCPTLYVTNKISDIYMVPTWSGKWEKSEKVRKRNNLSSLSWICEV